MWYKTHRPQLKHISINLQNTFSCIIGNHREMFAAVYKLEEKKNKTKQNKLDESSNSA